ncbi:MAG: type I methionyl aminopeptidase [Bacteroidales bacterium]|nr:type I methionyl aminopeptidase [Bacteroidales bacterium]
MIYIKTSEEIEIMRESVLSVSRTLALVAEHIGEGVATEKLDKLAEEFIRDNGGEPSFKGYQGFPATLCMSVNEEVVHGIPGNCVLKSGDVISVDCGVYKNGFHGDHAYSFKIGEVSEEVSKLLRITKESLYKGIDAAIVSNRIGDIGYAIQSYVQNEGYSVVRELTGHGLGKSLHEDPSVPNFGKRGRGQKIENGMVLAIEPMINMGKKAVRQLADGWTIITADKKPSAHFEHDVAIINGKAEILSTFDLLEDVLIKRGMEIS